MLGASIGPSERDKGAVTISQMMASAKSAAAILIARLTRRTREMGGWAVGAGGGLGRSWRARPCSMAPEEVADAADQAGDETRPISCSSSGAASSGAFLATGAAADGD